MESHWRIPRCVSLAYPSSCTPASADLIRLPRRSTLRCIAERLLPEGHQRTYLPKEIANEKVAWQPPTKRYHIYCSPKNMGALELMKEFADHQGLTLQLGCRRRSSLLSGRGKRSVICTTIHATQDVDKLSECDAVLVYLTAQTWTRANASSVFGSEVGRAMDAGVRLLLVHEMLGVGGQEARFGCEFAKFFSCDDGATPVELLNRGIYDEIAIALKGGEWRKTSMVMLTKAFAGFNAIGEKDANELKSAQVMSKGVQQELGMLTLGNAAASTAVRRQASTMAESLGQLRHWLGEKTETVSVMSRSTSRVSLKPISVAAS